MHRPPAGQVFEPPVDDFWPEVGALGLADPDPDSDEDEDEDFVEDAGFESEEESEEEEDPESLPAATLDDDPDRLSVR